MTAVGSIEIAVGGAASSSGGIMVEEGTAASAGALANRSDSAAGSHVGLGIRAEGRVQKQHRPFLILTMPFH